KQIGVGAGLCESGDTDDDQVDRHDVVQQPRHQQDKDAGDEGNKRRDLGNGNGHRGLLRRQSMILPFMHTRRQTTRKLRNLLRRPGSPASRSNVATWLDQSVFLNRLYRKSQWLALCMMVCVRVSFMSGPNPSAMVKSALQTSRNPSSGSLNSL